MLKPSRNSGKRVVVTGFEAASAFGIGADLLWQSLVSNKNGIRQIDQFDASTLPVRIAGDVPSFDIEGFIRADAALFAPQPESRSVQYSLESARRAITMAGLDYRNWPAPERVGVFIADRENSPAWYLSETAPLRVASLDAEKKEDLGHTMRRISEADPLRRFRHLDPTRASVTIQTRMGIEGPNLAIGTACASGNDAIGQAAQYVIDGEIDIAVAGGVFELDPISMVGFARIEALTKERDPEIACRPFDRARSGFVMGSGCGVLILESEESARKRGARIWCEVAGYANSCDAYRATDPHPDAEGAYRALTGAMLRAGVNLGDIDYVAAHGTSTKLNDRAETIALKRALGEHAKTTPISASKSMIGHTIMAAGAIQAVVAIKTIETGIVHPTRNLENRDPACDLHYVPTTAIEKQVDVVASNGFGFGGQNACVIFRRFR